MSYGTVIQQGKFTANGNAKILQLRNGTDWVEIINFTEATATNMSHGVKYSWQLGMALNDGIVEYHPAADSTLAIDGSINLGSPGFKLVDSSLMAPSAPIITAAATNVVAPVVATADTTGISVGSIVRLVGDAGNPNIQGIDFQVGAINPGVSFTIAYNLANAPGAAGIGGFYRIIANDSIFYPARKTVCNITQAAQAVITTTVSNGYTVGQKIRFMVPDIMGMIEMNGLLGTVVATAAGNFTVDIDTTTFTPFVWPGILDVPFTPAEAIPVGEDTPSAIDFGVDILGDATINNSYIGIILGAGVLSPAGSNGDVIYWKAGKSENV